MQFQEVQENHHLVVFLRQSNDRIVPILCLSSTAMGIRSISSLRFIAGYRNRLIWRQEYNKVLFEHKTQLLSYLKSLYYNIKCSKTCRIYFVSNASCISLLKTKSQIKSPLRASIIFTNIYKTALVWIMKLPVTSLLSSTTGRCGIK